MKWVPLFEEGGEPHRVIGKPIPNTASSPVQQRVFLGLAWNGEGGIRTHEGVTPTRFRVVRIQPGSATSPSASSAFLL